MLFRTLGVLGKRFAQAFLPSKIGGLQLWLDATDTTTLTMDASSYVSSWTDKSSNAYNFDQAVAAAQPQYLTPSKVDFDGVNDFLQKGVVDVFSSDNSGIMFFSGYYKSGSNNYVITSGSTSNASLYIVFGVRDSGQIFVQTGSNLIYSTNTVADGAYYYGYISSNGTSYVISLNGVEESKNILVGADNGEWFGDIALGRDNLTLSSLHRTTQAFSPSKIKDVIYYNTLLTSGEITSVNNYLSTT